MAVIVTAAYIIGLFAVGMAFIRKHTNQRAAAERDTHSTEREHRNKETKREVAMSGVR